MSSKKSKRTNKLDNTRTMFTSKDRYVGKDNVIAYLLDKMKSLSGYRFISIGPAGSFYNEGPNRDVVLITAHWSLPAMLPTGQYASDRDKALEAIKVNDSEFKGIVIDKHGNGIIGNPFAPLQNNDLPALGEQTAENITAECAAIDPCAQDAVIETL